MHDMSPEIARQEAYERGRRESLAEIERLVCERQELILALSGIANDETVVKLLITHDGDWKRVTMDIADIARTALAKAEGREVAR
jgi:hypothetical protein